MPQAPDTPFSSMAAQLYPEDKDSAVTEDARDSDEGDPEAINNNGADSGEPASHTPGHRLAQALEDTLVANGKSQSDAQSAAGTAKEPAQAGGKGNAPAPNDAPANGDAFTRNMLGVVLGWAE